MAQSILQYWPIMDTQAVCLSQNVTGAPFTMLLNGSLANIATPNQVSFIRNGFSRTVSFTSQGITPGSFTTAVVTGFQNGAIVTSTVGPLATSGTIYTLESYDLISSVQITVGGTGYISVGTGTTGFLPLIALTTVTPVFNYATSIILNQYTGPTAPPSPTSHYTLWSNLDTTTLNNGISLDILTGDLGYAFFPVGSYVDQTTSQLISGNSYLNNLLIQITASTSTDYINVIFKQA